MSWFPSIRPMARSLSAVSGWMASAGLLLAAGCVAGPAPVPNGGLMSAEPVPCTGEACPPTGHAKRAKHEKKKPHASEELVASSTVKPPTARFHPVPTRPVFSPKPGDPPPMLLGSPPEGEFGPPLVSPGELIPTPAPTMQAPAFETPPQPTTALVPGATQQASMKFPPPPMPGKHAAGVQSPGKQIASQAGPMMPAKPGNDSPVTAQQPIPAGTVAATRVPSSITLKSSSPAIAGLRTAPATSHSAAGKGSSPVSLALAAQSPVAQVTAEVEPSKETFAVIPGGSAALYLQTQKAPVLSAAPIAPPIPTGMSMSVPAAMPLPVQTAMPSSATTPEMPESKLATLSAYRDAKASVLSDSSPVKLASSEMPVSIPVPSKPEPSTRFLAPPAPGSAEITAAPTPNVPSVNEPALNAPALNAPANAPAINTAEVKSTGTPTPAKLPAALASAHQSATVTSEPTLAAPMNIPVNAPSVASATPSNWEQRSLLPGSAGESKKEVTPPVETGWKPRR